MAARMINSTCISYNNHISQDSLETIQLLTLRTYLWRGSNGRGDYSDRSRWVNVEECTSVRAWCHLVLSVLLEVFVFRRKCDDQTDDEARSAIVR